MEEVKEVCRLILPAFEQTLRETRDDLLTSEADCCYYYYYYYYPSRIPLLSVCFALRNNSLPSV